MNFTSRKVQYLEVPRAGSFHVFLLIGKMGKMKWVSFKILKTFWYYSTKL